METVFTVLIAGVAAFIFGTFIEYVVHRLMHWNLLYGEGHRFHHETGDARTLVKDLFDYGSGALLLGWPGFLYSTTAGFGWLAGGFVYAAMASYAHQLQHAHAHLVFWLHRPVHAIHHALDQRDRNFGILVDWWDRLFGTYDPVEWPKPADQPARSGYLDIPWWRESQRPS